MSSYTDSKDALPPPYYNADGRQSAPPTYPAHPSRTQPGTPPAGGSSSSGIGGFLKGLSGHSPPDLLNPPPPSFSRPLRRELPYNPFPPMTALGFGATLDQGFSTVPPTTVVNPHPFVTHDVCEEDWTRFVGDLQKVGTLSPMNKIVAGVAPIGLGIGLAGIFVSRAIERRMKSKTSAPATQIVDHWNNYFFWPRGMQVDLIHGKRVYTEHDSISADMAQAGYVPSVANDSSSSDSEDDDRLHDAQQGAQPGGAGSRKAEKRARREERRSHKRERKQAKKDKRKARKEPWKLLITYRPLA
ncbi:uncharacterized protein PHACADRAFT_207639 [Phanerochaete carnosa HHB-10118-sp]|uniref:Uncharacterized protein n=1 Tax=Phanerochaete carnosa (strain HHB-10118-sp) TaxID=650164 RepID=K5V1L6_PHACS|nr:uncharacterized protein PHACADRAFT_207639 [Phanerochaete carnosa HHB-10118-sp]EKM56386.1 hypothetical protein PHACADRAFT_207639 [Phanerochaete carnosa HHB-10118-sp]